ncbi:hypothetical protein ACLOJK_020539 [Asimina triloba]
MNTSTATHFLLVAFCLITASAFSVADQSSRGRGRKDDDSGFFGPGGGSFDIPGLGRMPDFGSGVVNGGFGGGFGGPSGGHSKNGVVRSTVICKERGPCHMKRLTCPAKCSTSYSYAGKNYGGGGGGGGCTIDCKKKCVAYC